MQMMLLSCRTAQSKGTGLSWRLSGYQGALTVAGHGAGSVVTVRVTVPGIPDEVDEEITRGIRETLDRIGRLTRT